MTSTKDLGYDGYYTRTLPSQPRQSPIQARNNTPPGALGLTHLSSPLNPTTDITFSSTDSDTAAWTEGTIFFGDGSATDLLPAGNTGDITGTTFVYYDKNRPGELRTTETPQDATGPAKVMMAIVDQGSTDKDCKIVTALGSGLTVSGITASQIEANTITGNEISATQLSALATDTGTLDVDEYITVGGDNNIKIDGNNKRITVSDGSNLRILIGYQSGGF